MQISSILQHDSFLYISLLIKRLRLNLVGREDKRSIHEQTDIYGEQIAYPVSEGRKFFTIAMKSEGPLVRHYLHMKRDQIQNIQLPEILMCSSMNIAQGIKDQCYTVQL